MVHVIYVWLHSGKYEYEGHELVTNYPSMPGEHLFKKNIYICPELFILCELFELRVKYSLTHKYTYVFFCLE